MTAPVALREDRRPPAPQERGRSRFWDVPALPWAVGLLAAAVTSTGSGIPSYWNDEAATLRLARLPVGQLLDFVQHKDAVHAVYALLVHVWIGWFGEAEVVVRAPSAIAVGVAAAGVFALLRHPDPERDRPVAALVAAVVFTLLPRVSANGVEARSYALSTALVVWAVVWAVRAGRDGGARRWVALTLTAGGAAAVFPYALLVVPALALAVLLPERARVDAARRPTRPAARRPTRPVARRRTPRVVPLTLSLVGAVVLAGPVLVVAASEGGQIAWLRSQPVTPWTVVVEPVFDQSWWLAALVVLVLAVAAVRAGRSGPREPGLVVVLLTWIVVPTVVLVVASVVVSPVFTPRYLSVVTPAVAVLVGLAICSWRPPVVWVLTVAIVVAAVPADVHARTPLGKPAGIDLRSVAAVVHDGARPGDGYLLSDRGTVSLRPRNALAAYRRAFRGLDDVAFLRSYAGTGTYSDVLVRGAALERRLRHEHRVWVAVPEAGDAALVRQVRAAGFTTRHTQQVAGATVTLWTR